MITVLATVHFNFQSSIVFELADNTLCCNIMQYLGKMIIGDVTLPLFDGVFKILYLFITLRLISQRNLPD